MIDSVLYNGANSYRKQCIRAVLRGMKRIVSHYGVIQGKGVNWRLPLRRGTNNLVKSRLPPHFRCLV